MRKHFFDEPKLAPFAARGKRVPRIGAVTGINETKGTVTLRWLDKLGGRVAVPITQSAPGDFGFPTKDDIAICVVDEYETPYIVRYVKTNYEGKVARGEARQIRSGERLITSIGGASIYLTKRGSVLIQDPVGDEWLIDRNTGTIEHRSINYVATTEAGVIRSGLVTRALPDATLGVDVDTVIENASSEALTEYVIQIYEVADLEIGVDTTQDPIVDIRIGTKVDSSGNKTLSAENNEICLDISTKSSVGFRLLVDKLGNLEIEANKIVVRTEDTASIQLGGTSGDQLATKAFVTSVFDSHIHTVTNATPAVPGPVITGAPTPSSNNDSYTDKLQSE